MDCPHGMGDSESCSYCRKPPRGINEIVYWTAGGDAFHNQISCELLSGGQHMAARVGLRNHPIQTGKYGSVGERGACSWCCAYFFASKLGENRRCLVKITHHKEWVEVQYLASRMLVPAKPIYEYRVRTDNGEEVLIRKPNIRFSKD